MFREVAYGINQVLQATDGIDCIKLRVLLFPTVTVLGY